MHRADVVYLAQGLIGAGSERTNALLNPSSSLRFVSSLMVKKKWFWTYVFGIVGSLGLTHHPVASVTEFDGVLKIKKRTRTSPCPILVPVDV